jgi:hypothetical protein
MLSATYKPLLMSVVMLSVVAPLFAIPWNPNQDGLAAPHILNILNLFNILVRRSITGVFSG